MKKRICIMLVVAILVLVVSGPLYSQEASAGSRIWFGIPLYVSGQFDFNSTIGQSVLDAVVGVVRDIGTRSDVNVGFQVFFPLGPVFSIGPEIAVSAPLAALVFGDVIVHVPLRAVLNIALSEAISLEALVGTELNIWSAQLINFNNMTFDVGARLDLAGFLIDVSYTLPFSVNLGDPQLGSVPANFWENGLSVGLGGRIKI